MPNMKFTIEAALKDTTAELASQLKRSLDKIKDKNKLNIEIDQKEFENQWNSIQKTLSTKKFQNIGGNEFFFNQLAEVFNKDEVTGESVLQVIKTINLELNELKKISSTNLGHIFGDPDSLSEMGNEITKISETINKTAQKFPENLKTWIQPLNEAIKRINEYGNTLIDKKDILSDSEKNTLKGKQRAYLAGLLGQGYSKEQIASYAKARSEDLTGVTDFSGNLNKNIENLFKSIENTNNKAVKTLLNYSNIVKQNDAELSSAIQGVVENTSKAVTKANQAAKDAAKEAQKTTAKIQQNTEVGSETITETKTYNGGSSGASDSSAININVSNVRESIKEQLLEPFEITVEPSGDIRKQIQDIIRESPYYANLDIYPYWKDGTSDAEVDIQKIIKQIQDKKIPLTISDIKLAEDFNLTQVIEQLNTALKSVPLGKDSELNQLISELKELARIKFDKLNALDISKIEGVVKAAGTSEDVENLRMLANAFNDISYSLNLVQSNSIGLTEMKKNVKAIVTAFQAFKLSDTTLESLSKFSDIKWDMDSFKNMARYLKEAGTLFQKENGLDIYKEQLAAIEQTIQSFSQQISNFSQVTNGVIDGLRPEKLIISLSELKTELQEIRTQLSSNSEMDKDFISKFSSHIDELKAKLTELSPILKETFSGITDEFKSSLAEGLSSSKENIPEKIFALDDLKKNKQIYFGTVKNSVKELTTLVEDQFSKKKYSDVFIKDIVNTEGQITSFKVIAKDATDVLREFNFEKQKVQGKGERAFDRFVEMSNKVSNNGKEDPSKRVRIAPTAASIEESLKAIQDYANANPIAVKFEALTEDLTKLQNQIKTFLNSLTFSINLKADAISVDKAKVQQVVSDSEVENPSANTSIESGVLPSSKGPNVPKRFKDLLGDIVKIERTVRRDDKDKKDYISYKYTGSTGATMTTGKNGGFLFGHNFELNEIQTQKDLYSSLSKYLSLWKKYSIAAAKEDTSIKADLDAQAKSLSAKIAEIERKVLEKIKKKNEYFDQDRWDKYLESKDLAEFDVKQAVIKNNEKQKMSTTKLASKNIYKDINDLISKRETLQRSLDNEIGENIREKYKTELKKIEKEIFNKKELIVDKNGNKSSLYDARSQYKLEEREKYLSFNREQRNLQSEQKNLLDDLKYAIIDKNKISSKGTEQEIKENSKLNSQYLQLKQTIDSITTKLKIKFGFSQDQIDKIRKDYKEKEFKEDSSEEPKTKNVSEYEKMAQRELIDEYKKLNSLEKERQRLISNRAEDSELNAINNEIEKQKSEVKSLEAVYLSSFNSGITPAIEKARSEIQNLLDHSSSKKFIEDSEKRLGSLIGNKENVANLELYNATIEKLKEKLIEIKNIDELKDADIFNDSRKKVESLFSYLNSDKFKKAPETSVSKLIKNITRYQASNTAAAKYDFNGLNFDYLTKKMDSMTSRLQAGIAIDKEEVKALGVEFNNLQARIALAGKEGLSFLDQIKLKAKSFASWIATYFGFQQLIMYGRQMLSMSIDINTKLTELSKVSNATFNELENQFNEFEDVAKSVGGTISDTISATADWSRLGYSLPDSKELARVAQIYKNVGDGIDINEANQSLISTLQGFELQAKDSLKIIDSFNEVANNFPIDTAGIGAALQRSAAAFNAANTDLNESIALVTGSNAVLQDPEKVGKHIADYKNSYIG